LLSLGEPSYGKYNDPLLIGVNPLTSKRYLPGAHAYMLKPKGARSILDVAKYSAQPTDIFLNIEVFPWLQEFYPWPAIAMDSFTTIQREAGCVAKHRYKPGYEIL
jgi:GR25 family glycosyltransferase involved in LPS biosynthesis